MRTTTRTRGMICPKCEGRMNVVDSRQADTGRRRVYHCVCGHKLSTIETPERSADGARVNVSVERLKVLTSAAMKLDEVRRVMADV